MLSLSGNVIDEVSGESLVGVEVKIEGSDVKTYTDFDGHFVINNLKAGQGKFVASYTSYKEKLDKAVDKLKSNVKKLKEAKKE